ncbi:MAG: InlB B-repeat-containing protein, partial [Bacteroidales bacterium]
YTVNFVSEDTNKGTVSPESASGNFGAYITSTATAKTNYTFDGWYDYNDNPITATSTTADVYVSGTTLNVKSSPTASGKTYTAKFTANKYTVNFLAMTDGLESTTGGEVSPTSASGDFGTYIESTATAKLGYAFDGWYDGNTQITTTSTTANAYVSNSGLTLNLKSSSSVSGKTYTAKFINHISESGVAAPRIYVHGSGDQAKLMLTKDPTNYGVMFQFGSVLAWSGTSSAATVAWNVTTLPSTWIGSWRVGSSFPTQTPENVQYGKGDPCKLVGLSISQISGGTVDNRKWRTPTTEENKTFGATYSNWKIVSGISGRYFGPGATSTGTGGEFLPAAGYRIYSIGSLLHQGMSGYYWSCTPLSNTNGSNLGFTSSSVYPEANGNQSDGHPVRCVPQ